MAPESDGQEADVGRPPAEAPVPSAPRSVPTPSGARSWLHRFRRGTQPTPADPDLGPVDALPKLQVSLLTRGPFGIGFFLTLGALCAGGVVFGLYRISSVLVLVVLSLFLALGLNPLVEWLQNRGVPRGIAVTLVALSVSGMIALSAWAVFPVATEQINRLLLNAPGFLEDLRQNPQIASLDAQFDIINKVSEFLVSGGLLTTLFGGLVGAGQVLAGLVFNTVITIVLTLYFLGSMQTFKDALLELAPASRRPRVRYLVNEMFGRIGGYVTGLFIVVSCAATVAFLFMNIVGITQYAFALSVVVALCAFIPLIGSTLSMIIVSIVAFAISPTIGLITLIFFLIYQQIDTYFIQPRVFQRSVNVPGPLVILAAMSGGLLYGMLGALLAIPSTAALMLLYREVLIPALNRR